MPQRAGEEAEEREDGERDLSGLMGFGNVVRRGYTEPCKGPKQEGYQMRVDIHCNVY